MRQAGLFGLSDQLKRLSDCGDPLETMSRVVDFEVFRPALEKALAYGDGAKGGRPPYDPVAMFKVLILAAQNTVSDARKEFLMRDRLSWLRFLGFDLGAVRPDENTIRLLREELTRAGAQRRAVRRLRPAATGSWLSADRRTDRRRHAGGRPSACFPMMLRIAGTLAGSAQAAQHHGREGRDQGGQERDGDLAGPASQGGAEGHRCPLDAEVRQGPAAARRQAGDRHRHPQLWLAVAPCAAVAGSLVPAGTDQTLDVGLHDGLQLALGHRPQEVAIAGLRHELGKG